MAANVPPAAPPDYARTSVRPRFVELPPDVRSAVGRLAGSPVVGADAPVGSGFTGSYAGVLHLADGRRVFAKAGGPHMPHVVAGLRREAQVLPLLTGLRCTPRLIGTIEVATDTGEWVVLVLAHIAGRQPGMPWTALDARAAHAACLEVATLPSDQTAPLNLEGLADAVAADWGVSGVFAQFAAGERDWPPGIPLPSAQRLDELDELVARSGTALEGEALCHNDVRPDNLLIGEDGAHLVDWNWVRAGPAWMDFVGLWPQMQNDGIALTQFAGSPLLAAADEQDIDTLLAVIAAYMLDDHGAPPPPGCTPALRTHQLWQARLFIELLAERRSWTD